MKKSLSAPDIMTVDIDSQTTAHPIQDVYPITYGTQGTMMVIRPARYQQNMPCVMPLFNIVMTI